MLPNPYFDRTPIESVFTPLNIDPLIGARNLNLFDYTPAPAFYDPNMGLGVDTFGSWGNPDTTLPLSQGPKIHPTSILGGGGIVSVIILGAFIALIVAIK